MAVSISAAGTSSHFFSTKIPAPTNNPHHLQHQFPFSSLTKKTSSLLLSFNPNNNGNGGVVSDSRNWRNSGIGDFIYDQNDDDESDDESEDRSLDLLVRFVQNVFRKISKRARKAVRSVLPISISTQLVGFSVNGVIILAFLWVLKAFLEVVCTFGSLVFVSILLIRGIWSGISYLQETRNRNANDFDDGTWTGAQPAG
ncbi:hypothetical protein ACHQM5_024793 [Ranunculus cassubicifolius]